MSRMIDIRSNDGSGSFKGSLAVPVAGVETASKLVDEMLPSNTLMTRWKGSEGR